MSSCVTVRCYLLVSILLISCAPPAPRQPAQKDPTYEPWYAHTVQQLAAIDRDARQLFQKGKSDEAAALIQAGEPLSKRLISVPRPTLTAMEAIADLDQLYGEMLFSNRNYGWARLFFQKNLVRWKYWKPQTADTEARLKQAQSAIADCDLRIGTGR